MAGIDERSANPGCYTGHPRIFFRAGKLFGRQGALEGRGTYPAVAETVMMAERLNEVSGRSEG